jgi:DNA polymerase-3 subunit alpha
VGGLVVGLQRKWTRKGDLMAIFTLEDLTDSVEALVFPKTMASVGDVLKDDVAVIAKVRVDRRDDKAKLIVMEIEVFETTADADMPLRIRLTQSQLRDDVMQQLKKTLLENPGTSEVYLSIADQKILRLDDEFNVDNSGNLVAQLKVMLGPDSIIS